VKHEPTALILVDVQRGMRDPAAGNRAHGGQLGFDTIVLSDASITFAKQDHAGVPRSADEVHAISLANLDGEYAAVMSTAQIVWNPQWQP